MLRTTLIRSTFFVALVAWGAAGCSSAAPPSESPTGQSGSPATGAATVPRPFESLLVLSQDNQKALHDAEELAVSECMKAQGFRDTPQAFESAQPADGPGMGDVAAARTRGYGIAEARQRGRLAVAENDPDKDPDLGRLTAQERQAFTAALIGPAPTGPNDPSRATIALPGGATVSVNTNGCASKGRAAVYGDDLRWEEPLFGTVEDLRAKAYDGLSTDPAYESAVQQWRTCMRGKGFNYEGPDVALLCPRQADQLGRGHRRFASHGDPGGHGRRRMRPVDRHDRGRFAPVGRVGEEGGRRQRGCDRRVPGAAADVRHPGEVPGRVGQRLSARRTLTDVLGRVGPRSGASRPAPTSSRSQGRPGRPRRPGRPGRPGPRSSTVEAGDRDRGAAGDGGGRGPGHRRADQSPAEIAAASRPPALSTITAPVERRTLDAKVVTRGTVAAASAVDVECQPVAAGASAATKPVFTRHPPAPGTAVSEGELLAEVNGRPVLLLQGDTPAFRELAPGAKGADVSQLQAALGRLGFDP